tara:strand:- start:175 stop:1332 length:1158 start_codon:yes stop_codon:yes gene_type:complete
MNIKKDFLPSKRSLIEKFFVMDVLNEAKNLEALGKKIFHLELGEPINFIPKKIINSLNRFNYSKIPGYTPSNGEKELREKLSFYYQKKNININSEEIFITVGSSGAFLLTFLACFDPGDTVAVFSPSYPAYKNILNSVNIKVLEIKSSNKLFIDLNEIRNYKKIDGLIISSPNNPNGQIFNEKELKFIYEFCLKNDIRLISDEIYHGISFDKQTLSIRNFGKNVIVVNSFSKFFCMPGWRLGWVIVPKTLIENFLRLSQNLFISCGSIAQKLAVDSLECEKEYQKVTKIYKKNRDLVVNKLSKTPWNHFTKAEGSFYTYIDLSKHTDNSQKLTKKILTECGVALTPGIDFDSENGNSTIRLSFSSHYDYLLDAMKKLVNWINQNY